MATEICVYCGETSDLTDDHVPPRSFFGTPPPPNLITVPACSSCNAGFNVDDDYVRLVLTSDERAKGNDERDQILPSVLRYSQRREARRSLAQFWDTLTRTYRQNPQGIIVPMQYHVVNGNRMNAFAVRVVKALFYREKGYRLPDSIQVKPLHRLFIPSFLESENGDLLEMILTELQQPGSRRAWGQVFAYSWIQSPNDINQTWWLLEFYGSLEWLCSTVNPALLGNDPAATVNH
jgi:hypothetical protein